MNHSDMEDLYELYVLNLLDAEATAEIRGHLETQCDVCTARARDAEKLTAALSTLAGRAEPPAKLRDRVLRIARPQRNTRQWIFAFAAAALAAFLLFAWGYQQLAKTRAMTGEISDLLRERNALRSALTILTESDMKTVSFGANQNVPHGRVFVSNSGGVVFVGSQLPALSAERTFELWLIPAKGNPQAAGVFRANSAGVSVRVVANPVDTASIAAFAVSVEPSAGSPQPTTKPILIIPLG